MSIGGGIEARNLGVAVVSHKEGGYVAQCKCCF